jgi:DNA mismatch repair protein MutS
MADATPMLQQYRQLKKRFPDAILLFRLGDFYEMFDDDARLISKQLGLVLTGRRFSKSVKMAMCGVPYRQLSVYVSKLLEKGHKVAVADQMEAAGKSRGLIAREIVRVITPGTVVEEALLAEKSQNFLAALAPSENLWGLAAVDLSTGEFVTAQFSGATGWSQLLEEMNVLRPTELLLPAPFVTDEGWLAGLGDVRPARLSPLDPARFDPADASQRLLTHFAAASLDAYGCAGLPQATAAAGAVLAYLQENQLSDLAHLTGLTTYRAEACVGLDPVTRRNLELTATLRDGRVQGSLLAVLDRTSTAMGARLLRRWIQQPLLELAPIVERLDAVEELAGQRTEDSEQSAVTSRQSPVPNPQSPVPAFLRTDLRKLLDGVYDMERSVGRVGFGTANARDLAGLRRTLSRIPRIKALLAGASSPRLAALNAELDPLQDVAGLIGEALVDDPPILLKEGGLIRPGYHSELAKLRGAAADGRDWLTAYEAEERERTGIPTLRVRYNQIFGFFVEVPRSKSSLVPAEYERRATITHAERFVTPALRRRESEILAAEDRANELEYELFVELRQQVAAHSQRLLAAARLLAELDVLASLAESAVQQNYCRPTVDESHTIRIEEGRHPVVEQLLSEGKRYVPNDIALDGEGRRMLILTGPNMSGKSVLTRQVVLTVLMAQMGSFVPARPHWAGGSDFCAGRGQRRHHPGALDFSGGDGRDRLHSAPRHLPQSGGAGRSGSGHLHLRRDGPGLGRGRGTPRRHRLPQPLRHPVSRTDRPGRPVAGRVQRQPGRARAGPRRRLSAPAGGGGRGSQLRRAGGPAGRCAGTRHRAGTRGDGPARRGEAAAKHRTGRAAAGFGRSQPSLPDRGRSAEQS